MESEILTLRHSPPYDEFYPPFDVDIINAAKLLDFEEWPESWRKEYDSDTEQMTSKPINNRHVLAAVLSLLDHEYTKPIWDTRASGRFGFSTDIGFTERIYGFVDGLNNLCIFTDSYHPNWISTFRHIPKYVYQDVTDSLQQCQLVKEFEVPDVITELIADLARVQFDISVYQNTGGHLEHGRVEIDLGFFKRLWHREYFVIARYPFSSWKKIFDRTFWAFYGDFYFNILCQQHIYLSYPNQNYSLYEAVECGRKYIPCCEDSEDWNYILYSMDNATTTYAQICKCFVCDYDYYNVDIPLFAIAYSNWFMFCLLRNSIDNKRVALIIASMICGGWQDSQTDDDNVTFSMPELRYVEILAVKDTGNFVLNPFKYGFLSEKECMRLRAQLLQKYVQKNSEWLDGDDPGLELEYNIDMYAHLWKCINNVDIGLSKEDILNCLCSTNIIY